MGQKDRCGENRCSPRHPTQVAISVGACLRTYAPNTATVVIDCRNARPHGVQCCYLHFFGGSTGFLRVNPLHKAETGRVW